MPKIFWPVAILAALAGTRPPIARAAPAPAPAAKPDAKPDDARSSDAKPEELKAEEKTSTGAVTIGGRRIDYTAIAGSLVVHPRGAEDRPEPPRLDQGDGDKGEKPIRGPRRCPMLRTSRAAATPRAR